MAWWFLRTLISKHGHSGPAAVLPLCFIMGLQNTMVTMARSPVFMILN